MNSSPDNIWAVSLLDAFLELNVTIDTICLIFSYSLQ
jgi:hypothetical protein